MRRLLLPIAIVFVGVFVVPAVSGADGTDASSGSNSVVVESKTVYAGQTGVEVGAFVSNDVGVKAIVLPFEIRAIDAGSFITNSFELIVQGRIVSSPLMDLRTKAYYDSPSESNSCSGPISSTYGNFVVPPLGSAYFDSPSGVYFTGDSYGFETMSPGSDGAPGSGTPSILFTFDVTTTPGSFEIDTMCALPVTHLAMVDENFEAYPVQFTNGVITIIPCQCNCFGDPICDGVADVFDLVRTVDIAFRNGPPAIDSSPDCPRSPTDVNCDGVTNVFDYVKLINVIFRAADPATAYCDPCSD